MDRVDWVHRESQRVVVVGGPHRDSVEGLHNQAVVPVEGPHRDSVEGLHNQAVVRWLERQGAERDFQAVVREKLLAEHPDYSSWSPKECHRQVGIH
jgi:hypothetical protein